MPEYRITKDAGPFVAGRRNTGAGTTMFLTPREAAHDLRVGALEEIRRKAAKKPAADTEPGGAS